jgi:hypothetical protein
MIDNGITYILYTRIKKLLPNNPEIMNIKNPWDLSEIKGFNIDGLDPALHQVSIALSAVQKGY